MTEHNNPIVRSHGRSATQSRSITCERGLLLRADGSAKWCQDNCCVVAGVYGPRQAQQMKEDAEAAIVEVQVKPRNGIQEFKDRSRYEVVVKGVVEAVIQSTLHPRTSVQIVLQVQYDDGALLSCLLNATCAALVDTGIPMTTLFGSVTCALLPGPVVLLDPTSKEEEAATAVVCIANPFHFDLRPDSSGKPAPCVEEGILASHTRGSCSVDQYLDMLDLCQKGTSQVAEFSRLLLKQG